MRYKIIFDTGYAGSWKEVFIIADSLEQVTNYANIILSDFAVEYAEFCIDPSNDEEVEEYYEDCGFSIEEISDEDYEIMYSKENWEDLTHYDFY